MTRGRGTAGAGHTQTGDTWARDGPEPVPRGAGQKEIGKTRARYGPEPVPWLPRAAGHRGTGGRGEPLPRGAGEAWSWWGLGRVGNFLVTVLQVLKNLGRGMLRTQIL